MARINLNVAKPNRAKLNVSEIKEPEKKEIRRPTTEKDMLYWTNYYTHEIKSMANIIRIIVDHLEHNRTNDLIDHYDTDTELFRSAENGCQLIDNMADSLRKNVGLDPLKES